MEIAGLHRKSDEVLVCSDEIIGLKADALLALKQMAADSVKKRARICAHKSSNSTIQEMIIVINRDSYIRPHRHQNKCESFHLIDGEADIVVFEDTGSIRKVIEFSKGSCFYYRLDDAYFHTIIVRSETIVFHEVTNGPFIENATEFAGFAPLEGELSVHQYEEKLDQLIDEWKSSHGV